MLPFDTAVSYRGVAGAGSDILGDSAMWVCAFLPVWSASPGGVVVCTLVPRGPPDVNVSEGGGHLAELSLAWLAWSGLWGLQGQGLSSSSSFSEAD